MFRSKKQRGVAAALAIAGLIGTVGVMSSASSADTVFTPADTIYRAAGYLAIETTPATGSGRVVYYDNDDNVIESVSLGVTKGAKCAVDTAAVSRLLGMSVTDPVVTSEVVGLVSNGLGVRTKNTCSTDSGRVAPGQTIQFSLDGTRFGAAYRIDYATFDIEGKQNAQVKATTVGRDGATDPWSLALESSKASDNGPDAGAGGNSTETVATPSDGSAATTDDQTDDFRTITFLSDADSGQFAIEGGGDYGDASVTTYSTKLYLVKQAYGVDCEESVLVNGDTGEAALTAEFRRLPNGAAKTGECDEVEVEIEIQDTGVYWNNEAVGVNNDLPQDVKAEVEIVWTPEDADVPMPPALINYEGNPNGPFVEVQWCLGKDSAGEWIHPIAVPARPDNPATPAVNEAEVPWCLIHEQFVLLDDGQVQRIEVYHGQGDPFRLGY